MNALLIRPRHLAAASYAIAALFLSASWLELLTPPDQAPGTLAYMFSPESPHQMFFIVFAAVTAFAPVLACAFCIRHAGVKRTAAFLFIVSLMPLACAGLWLAPELALLFTIGSISAFWSWRAPNAAALGLPGKVH